MAKVMIGGVATVQARSGRVIVHTTRSKITPYQSWVLAQCLRWASRIAHQQHRRISEGAKRRWAEAPWEARETAAAMHSAQKERGTP